MTAFDGVEADVCSRNVCPSYAQLRFRQPNSRSLLHGGPRSVTSSLCSHTGYQDRSKPCNSQGSTSILFAFFALPVTRPLTSATETIPAIRDCRAMPASYTLSPTSQLGQRNNMDHNCTSESMPRIATYRSRICDSPPETHNAPLGTKIHVRCVKV